MSDPTFCKMEFTKDSEGKEQLIKDDKFQVMMEWEKPYMEACIEELKPFGEVLEIGFGCGYSAEAIQKFPIKSHTIIEYHPVVFEKAKEWAKDKKNVTLIHDTWQNALPKLGQFDTIFFDDYPLESEAETKEAQKTLKKTIPILDKGKKLLEKVENQFTFLKTLKYSDADLEEFFAHVTKNKETKPEHFIRFFIELEKKGQITLAQLETVQKRLIDEGFATQTELNAFYEKQQTKPFAFRKTPDRFFRFLRPSELSHTRRLPYLLLYRRSDLQI